MARATINLNELPAFFESMQKNLVSGEKIGELALAGLTALERVNPVDTGYSRGNWYVTAHAPSEDEGKNSRGDAGGIADVQRSFKSGDDFDIYITNNVRYAIYLEYGHSQQAPNGMLTPATSRIIDWIQTNFRPIDEENL